MNPDVDASIARSKRWAEEMTRLRAVLLGCGLTEELRWGKPCYVHGGRNVAIVQELKDFLALMFFQGALLHDPTGVLEDQGPNSRSARRIRFTSVAEVSRLTDAVEELVAEAIAVADAGRGVGPPPELVLVAELRRRLDLDPPLRAAFEALTPGRQREYNLYVAGAKQVSTRTARVEKNVQRIIGGKGLRGR